MPVKKDFAKLQRFRRGVPDAIDAGVGETAEQIGDLAQQLAPEDTGDLKASKKVKKLAQALYEVSFGEDLPDQRAPAQEYGTIYQPAQPYLTPAATQISLPLNVKAKIKALL